MSKKKISLFLGLIVILLASFSLGLGLPLFAQSFLVKVDVEPTSRISGEEVVGLLEIPGVAAEIGLASAQQVKMRAFIEEGELCELGISVAASKNDKAETKKLDEQLNKLAADFLDTLAPGQFRRLRQLYLQDVGIENALRNPLERASLKLSPDQDRDVVVVLKRYDSEEAHDMEQAIETARHPDRKAGEKIFEAHSKSRREGLRSQIEMILTPDQRKAFKESCGALFTFPKNR